jgi:hypothetical protein
MQQFAVAVLVLLSWAGQPHFISLVSSHRPGLLGVLLFLLLWRQYAVAWPCCLFTAWVCCPWWQHLFSLVGVPAMLVSNMQELHSWPPQPVSDLELSRPVASTLFTALCSCSSSGLVFILFFEHGNDLNFFLLYFYLSCIEAELRTSKYTYNAILKRSFLRMWSKNRTMKPVKVLLRRWGGRFGRMMESMNLTKVHCKHIWKCHNEAPCATNIF